MRQLKRDWRKADLTEKHRHMLAFVEKLTVNPSGVSRGDMHTLLDAGFSERDYYDIVLITAHYNFITRVADAFGVELDEFLHLFMASVGEEAVFAAPAMKE